MAGKRIRLFGEEIEEIDLNNDDLRTKPIPWIGGSTQDPISVGKSTEKNHLTSGLIASLGRNDPMDISSAEDDKVEIINSIPSQKFGSFPSSVPAMGQSSKSGFTCEICVESKLLSEAFNILGCSHYYCSDCMVKYVSLKILENVVIIRCPEQNCQGVLEPDSCRSILPLEASSRWYKALRESLIPESHKLYCPYKNCSTLLVNDGGMLAESKCPHCQRMFCAQCKVPWHVGISCQEFEKSNGGEERKEEIMLKELAEENKWQRCPQCNIFVERTSGCRLMICRCGLVFCYDCGAQLDNEPHSCPSQEFLGWPSLQDPNQTPPRFTERVDPPLTQARTSQQNSPSSPEIDWLAEQSLMVDWLFDGWLM